MLSTAEIRKSGVNPSELRDMEYRKKNAKRWAYVSVLLLCMRCNKVRTTGLMYCCKKLDPSSKIFPHVSIPGRLFRKRVESGWRDGLHFPSTRGALGTLLPQFAE